MIDRCREAIVHGLAQGRPGIAVVAGALNMSVRTFQRRLAEAGWTYKELLDDVRFAEARRAMARPDELLKVVGHRRGLRGAGQLHAGLSEVDRASPPRVSPAARPVAVRALAQPDAGRTVVQVGLRAGKRGRIHPDNPDFVSIASMGPALSKEMAIFDKLTQLRRSRE